MDEKTTLRSQILLFLLFFFLISCSPTGAEGQPITDDDLLPQETTFVSHHTVELTSKIFAPSDYSYSIEDNIVAENELAFFDFDTGQFLGGESADVYLFISCGSDCFLSLLPLNGAKANRSEISAADSLAECESKFLGETNSSNGIPLGPNTFPGKYSCLVTSEGIIIKILIISNRIIGDTGWLKFEYWTNEK